MKDQFVTYEIAKRLKELKFNNDCLAVFLGNNGPAHICLDAKTMVDYYKGAVMLAPLWQQVINWLREDKNIFVWVECIESRTSGTFYAWKSNNKKEYSEPELKGQFYNADYICGSSDTYEQAREAAILKALELIKTHES